MSYLQQFGVSRISPLNLTEKEENPASNIIEENNFKTQSEHGMSDAEYAKYFSEGSIHNPVLDDVVVRSDVDYEENPDYEENLKKNLSASEYKRTLSEDFKNDPYKKELLHKGEFGRSDYSSASSIIPTPALEDVQEGLDYAGMVFPPADLLNMSISGAMATGNLLQGDFDSAAKHGKRFVKSGVSSVPIFGDKFAAGTKLAKLNTFGKSKGAIYKPGMFKPEKAFDSRNITRGFTNFALRKGKNTKLSDNVQKGIQTVLGKNKPGTFASEKITENFLSGKPIVKGVLSDNKKES